MSDVSVQHDKMNGFIPSSNGFIPSSNGFIPSSNTDNISLHNDDIHPPAIDCTEVYASNKVSCDNILYLSYSSVTLP